MKLPRRETLLTRANVPDTTLANIVRRSKPDPVMPECTTICKFPQQVVDKIICNRDTYATYPLSKGNLAKLAKMHPSP